MNARTILPQGLLVVALVAAVAAVHAPVAHGQEEEARFGAWQKVEGAAETRAFKETMRNGGAFDAAARTYLEQIALPQLAAEGNRWNIAFVRRRIKDFLLNEFGNEKAGDDANKTVMGFMETLAAKADEPAVVRVNAMLMIGELQGADRKPWAPAAATLARDAGSAKVPASVRLAAIVGLSRHVDAAKGNAAAAGKLVTLAAPAIEAILKEPLTPQSAVESNWLAARSLAMLAQLGPAGPEAVAEVVRVLDDTARSFDVRVRAAAALAAVVGKDAKVDGAAAIRSIDELAVAALKGDAAIADRVTLERAYTGGATGMAPSAGGMMPGMMPSSPYPGISGGMPGMEMMPGQPPVEQLIPREVCRRAAWRLATLADALLTVDGQKGLALLPGADAEEGRALAGKLRRAAMDLDASPDDVRIRQALEDLRPPPPPSEGDEEEQADKKMAEEEKPEAAAGENPAKPAANPPAPAAKPAGTGGKPTAKPAAAADAAGN